MRTSKVELTAEEKEDIYLALSFRCGFIETGTIHRAKDLEKCGQNERNKIRVISTEQMRKIIFLEDLMTKIVNS